MTNEATESNAETITMGDGRQVIFSGKRTLLKEVVIDEHNHPAVRLDFRNGETRLFKVPHSLMAQFAGHGASQKLGDETAGMKDIDDAVLAVDELIERLNKGEWTVRREGSGMAGTSVLLRALMELTGRPVEKVREFLKTKSQADKVALRNSAKLKPIIERLEAEKAAKAEKVDTEALLDELAA